MVGPCGNHGQWWLIKEGELGLAPPGQEEIRSWVGEQKQRGYLKQGEVEKNQITLYGNSLLYVHLPRRPQGQHEGQGEVSVILV